MSIVMVDLYADRSATHVYCVGCWDQIPLFLVLSHHMHPAAEVREWNAAATYQYCEGCNQDMFDEEYAD